MSPFLDEAVSVIRSLSARSRAEPIRSILEIGCGPGVATTTLAMAFPTRPSSGKTAHPSRSIGAPSRRAPGRGPASDHLAGGPGSRDWHARPR